MSDTIFALSSGALPAALGIVRISGLHAGAALMALTGALPPPRLAKLRHLRDPDNSELLDSALVLWFPGPATATGEDLAELHLHGGRAVVAAVLAVLARLPGLRIAEAGEFTRRALDTGRIDLIAAEGLADLLSAETESQRRNAMHLALGHVSQAIAGWQDRILRISAQIEAELNFGDEDDVVQTDASYALMCRQAQDVRHDMALWLAMPASDRLKDGVTVAIAGPPNAGKSTLFNALVQRDAAITSPIAGTTRDIIEGNVAIDGVALRIMDTAGLRDAGEDAIEAIGMDRAQMAIESADMVLWLGMSDAAPVHPRLMTIAAQSDRAPNDMYYGDQVTAPDIKVSALTGAGMADLTARILAVAQSMLPAIGETALNARHRALLGEAVAILDDDADAPHDMVLLAERLRLVRTVYDRITGKAGTEDMLDALFGRFCIGK